MNQTIEDLLLSAIEDLQDAKRCAEETGDRESESWIKDAIKKIEKIEMLLKETE